MSDNTKREFELAAAGQRRGLVREFFGFLNQTKKWWLLPIVLVVLVLGGLMLVGGGPAAPFIYTLF